MTLKQAVEKYNKLRDKLINKEVDLCVENQMKLKAEIDKIKSEFNSTYVGCSIEDRKAMDAIYDKLEKDWKELYSIINSLRDKI